MQPTKLTEAFIGQLSYEDTPVVVRDTIVKGLMAAVNKQSKSFKVYPLGRPARPSAEGQDWRCTWVIV